MNRLQLVVPAAVTVVLSLGLAATGVASAFAHEGRTQKAPRGAVHRYVGHGPARPGYVGPAYSVILSIPNGSIRFVPGQSMIGESCDLPTSACSNDERISN